MVDLYGLVLYERVHAKIQPTTDQCRSPVFVASTVYSAILSNTLKLTTFSLIVSMGLGPGGAVKHRSSLSFMNSPHRWTKVLKQT